MAASQQPRPHRRQQTAAPWCAQPQPQLLPSPRPNRSDYRIVPGFSLLNNLALSQVSDLSPSPAHPDQPRDGVRIYRAAGLLLAASGARIDQGILDRSAVLDVVTFHIPEPESVAVAIGAPRRRAGFW